MSYVDIAPLPRITRPAAPIRGPEYILLIELPLPCHRAIVPLHKSPTIVE
jgi:hypothetical protein